MPVWFDDFADAIAAGEAEYLTYEEWGEATLLPRKVGSASDHAPPGGGLRTIGELSALLNLDRVAVIGQAESRDWTGAGHSPHSTDYFPSTSWCASSIQFRARGSLASATSATRAGSVTASFETDSIPPARSRSA